MSSDRREQPDESDRVLDDQPVVISKRGRGRDVYHYPADDHPEKPACGTTNGNWHRRQQSQYPNRSWCKRCAVIRAADDDLDDDLTPIITPEHTRNTSKREEVFHLFAADGDIRPACNYIEGEWTVHDYRAFDDWRVCRHCASIRDDLALSDAVEPIGECDSGGDLLTVDEIEFEFDDVPVDSLDVVRDAVADLERAHDRNRAPIGKVADRLGMHRNDVRWLLVDMGIYHRVIEVWTDRENAGDGDAERAQLTGLQWVVFGLVCLVVFGSGVAIANGVVVP